MELCTGGELWQRVKRGAVQRTRGSRHPEGGAARCCAVPCKRHRAQVRGGQSGRGSEGRYSEREAAVIHREVLRGVAQCHAKGIVLR